MREDVAKFSVTIEKLVANTGLSYIDAIVEHCEKNNLEFEVAAKLLSPALKMKIQNEAASLHLYPKSETVKLPL